jgi:starch synthase (maltosyl-transferring)
VTNASSPAAASLDSASGGTATTPPLSTPPQTPIGRIPVQNVEPVVDNGARPAKSVVGETFPVSATVFREGHDAVNASLVLTDPDGREAVSAMVCANPGLNHWVSEITADRPGLWHYRSRGLVRSLRHVGSRRHDQGDRRRRRRTHAHRGRAAHGPGPRKQPGRSGTGRLLLDEAAAALADTGQTAEVRLNAGLSREVHEEMAALALRDMVSPSLDYPLLVERERALYGAWYEIFPRSEGCRYDSETEQWVSGTFATAAKRLPAIAAMGFDVVYLTPIHPIGRAARKGP